MKATISIFWFRRDLRLNDNAGLYHALRNSESVLPVFIFDTTILNVLDDKYDRRIDFIHQAITALDTELQSHGSALQVFYGTPLQSFEALCSTYAISTVYTNHDYEPYASHRDEAVKAYLSGRGITFETFKDQCIFEKNEVLKDDGKPYTVFTPYSRKWKARLSPFYYKPYPTLKYASRFMKRSPELLPDLESMGFKKTDCIYVSPSLPDSNLLTHYKDNRDFPFLPGTSRLSVHLRFGTVSIRQLVTASFGLSEAWLNELIWRDFYMMILWHFPHAAKSAFRPEYDRVEWRNDVSLFNKWCEGATGFPIVDAGMRELNATGFMHNRVRMIVSSFLVKDLLIDWRWGEAYFAKKLLDFDLSANNGGWQWAAGSGCDAAPYFRVFNPHEQQKKFDPEFKYIKKWVPEYGTKSYPLPVVDHASARVRAIQVYKEALSQSRQLKLM